MTTGTWFAIGIGIVILTVVVLAIWWLHSGD